MKTKTKAVISLDAVCEELKALQRQRSIVIKSKIMQANRLQSIVAGTIGYRGKDTPKADRERIFKEASKLIEQVVDEEEDHPLASVIKTTMIGVGAFDHMKDALEVPMLKCVEKLPVYKWANEPEQRGFGMIHLATTIGETGNLFNYANPAKLWRRMGCAPWEFDGKELMGCTWRSGRQGKLPAEEWEKFGYSPRRRSLAFLIGEGLIKQNGAGAAKYDRDGVLVKPARKCGPYREKYDEKKEEVKRLHPDYPDMRCHRHGMLIATKLLLKNLWVEWWGHPPMSEETKSRLHLGRGGDCKR